MQQAGIFSANSIKPIGCISIICVELFLRVHYGLCDAVLMRTDDDYEYIAKPNQRRKRFGNRVFYNSFSMRNDELRSNSTRILCIGDSILNGGTLIDQYDLATSILSERLSTNLKTYIQVLNISAGSWGPDNCLAWLKKHGDFGAKAIILVVSSHDVHDTMTFVPVVGHSKSYPSRQYSLAIFELWDRYLFPHTNIFHQTKASKEDEFRREHHIEQTNIAFNPGFEGILNYSKEHGIPFAIYLHATLYELNVNAYDKDGQAIINFCKEHGIPLMMDLKEGLSKQCFYKEDYMHYGKDGQRLMADILYPFMLKFADNGTR